MLSSTLFADQNELNAWLELHPSVDLRFAFAFSTGILVIYFTPE